MFGGAAIAYIEMSLVMGLLGSVNGFSRMRNQVHTQENIEIEKDDVSHRDDVHDNTHVYSERKQQMLEDIGIDYDDDDGIGYNDHHEVVRHTDSSIEWRSMSKSFSRGNKYFQDNNSWKTRSAHQAAGYGFGQHEFNIRGVGYYEYCIDQNVSFYRHFDEAVWDITNGTEIENENKRWCVCTSNSFILCDCSHLNYNVVPDALKITLNGLDLSRNYIDSLDNAPFNPYSEMTYLSLAYNLLSKISVGSFQGLNKLRVLDLRGNTLYMKEGVFPIGVFQPLISLMALRINKNNNYTEGPDLFYPDKALADLKSLRFLSMDGIKNKTFGEGFGTLTSLETLSLSGYTDGYCRLVALSNDTFQYLTQLKMLNISDCYLRGIHMHPNTLHHLKNLHTLDLSWNEWITIRKMMQLINGLGESNLKELLMQRIELMYQTDNKINLTYDGLPKNLTCLIASGNSVNYLNPDVFINLPTALRYLDFSGNRMMFGTYVNGLLLLKNLEVLKLNGYDTIFDIPTFWPDLPINPNAYSYPNDKLMSLIYDDNVNKDNAPLIFPIPPKVRILTMEYAGLRYSLGELNVTQNNSLEELYLENNMFPMLIGPFRGFNKLRILVFKFCAVQYISRDFFKNFAALELLDLRYNRIGVGPSLNHRLFQHLSSLTDLRLAYTTTSNLKHDTFYGLNSLKKLDISGNKLFYFQSNISHMSKLEVINLNKTAIHSLPLSTLEHIDSLNNISVYMSETPIDCSCGNLVFLDWFVRSKAIPSYSDHYICVLNVRKQLVLSHSQFASRVKIIRRRCAHNYNLFLVVLGVTLLALSLIIGSILYRFRWRLRYFYYGLHLWMTGKSKEEEEPQFKYDVFISYSNQDLNFVLKKICPELERRGLTVYIHSRDFRAGDPVFTNIITAVKSSRRTLIVLTNNFVSSKWCQTEFQMAKEESVVTGRKVLVFLVVDKIPKSKIGLELLTHIQQNTYLPYNGEVDNSEPGPNIEEQPISTREMKMWDKLGKDIKTSR